VSWSLKRTDVALRVAKFAPQTDKPVAGLSPMVRALWRDKREKEQKKVAPALELRR